jgi:hypothetical protein
MDLTEGISRRAVRMGQMLAFLAALFLAVNPHLLHAASDDGAGHSHFGSFCEALDTDKSPSGGEHGMPTSHGDCVHHFDPLVRAPIEHSPSYSSVAVAPLYLAPARQLSLGSEPPPPRHSS